MIITYTKEDFAALDFDIKCVIMEELLTDDYFSGQIEINFHYEIDVETGNLLPQPLEIQERKDKEFNQLIVRLTDKLFENNLTVELDLDKILED